MLRNETSRRAVLGGLAAAGTVTIAGPKARAQSKTIKLVFPYAAGGPAPCTAAADARGRG